MGSRYDLSPGIKSKKFVKKNYFSREQRRLYILAKMTEKKTMVLGASPNPMRFSYKAVKSLQRHNVPVVPVGIKNGEIGGIEILKNKPHLDKIHTITLYIGPARQKEYYSYILSLRPARIIFNPGTENKELMDMAREEGIEVLEDCTLIMVNADRY